MAACIILLCCSRADFSGNTREQDEHGCDRPGPGAGTTGIDGMMAGASVMGAVEEVDAPAEELVLVLHDFSSLATISRTEQRSDNESEPWSAVASVGDGGGVPAPTLVVGSASGDTRSTMSRMRSTGSGLLL